MCPPNQPAASSSDDVPVVPIASRRSAVIALLLVAPAPSLGVFFSQLLQGTPYASWPWAISKAWVIAVTVLWHLKVDRAPWSWSRPRLGGFGMAIALGLAISAVIFATYLIVGLLWIDPAQLQEHVVHYRLDDPKIFLAGALYWIVINAVLEEYVFRWFIFRKCELLMPGWAAVIAAALAFVAHHTVAMSSFFDWRANALASLGIFIGGAIWSALYLRFRSVWVPYVSHAIVDITVFSLGAWIVFK